jgi:hypothetical protein
MSFDAIIKSYDDIFSGRSEEENFKEMGDPAKDVGVVPAAPMSSMDPMDSIPVAPVVPAPMAPVIPDAAVPAPVVPSAP